MLFVQLCDDSKLTFVKFHSKLIFKFEIFLFITPSTLTSLNSLFHSFILSLYFPTFLFTHETFFIHHIHLQFSIFFFSRWIKIAMKMHKQINESCSFSCWFTAGNWELQGKRKKTTDVGFYTARKFFFIFVKEKINLFKNLGKARKLICSVEEIFYLSFSEIFG